MGCLADGDAKGLLSGGGTIDALRYSCMVLPYCKDYTRIGDEAYG
jgi:hypothetical protein